MKCRHKCQLRSPSEVEIRENVLTAHKFTNFPALKTDASFS